MQVWQHAVQIAKRLAVDKEAARPSWNSRQKELRNSRLVQQQKPITISYQIRSCRKSAPTCQNLVGVCQQRLFSCCFPMFPCVLTVTASLPFCSQRRALLCRNAFRLLHIIMGSEKLQSQDIVRNLSVLSAVLLSVAIMAQGH